MNIAQIASRLTSNYLSVRQPSEMAADHQQLLLDAIYQGFGRFFDLAPSRLRERTIGLRFGASVSGTAAVTNGSRTVSFTGVTPVAGATVEIAGDAAVNRVQSNPAGGWLLEIPYGGTTGSVAATVYRDTAVLDYEISGFIAQPYDARGDLELVEIPRGSLIRYDVASDRHHVEGAVLPGYRIEASGNYTIMRVIPAPTADLPVSCVADVSNLAIGGIGKITETAAPAVSVSNEHCTRFVIPFCGEELTAHPLWKNPGTIKVAETAAARARGDMALLRGKAGAGYNRIDAPCP